MDNILKLIRPADISACDQCLKRFDNVAKPLGSLGKLEEITAKIAGAQGTADINIEKKAVLIFCADNMVAQRGVAQVGSSVTVNIARSILRGTASVNVMAKKAGADTFPVDVGLCEEVEGLKNAKTRRSASDITTGPAMTRDECKKMILQAVEMVRVLKADGYGIIATGEAGIGNTTTSSAVCSVLLKKDAGYVTGRGSGLSDEGLKNKTEAIRLAIKVNSPDERDAVDVISKVGGFDIASMTGVFLGGALYHVPIVIDGLISLTAALCAKRLCPDCATYMIPSHLSAEPAAELILDELKMKPVIDAGMRLGEGTGAVAVLPLLDMALAVYYDAAKFEDIEVEKYKKI